MPSKSQTETARIYVQAFVALPDGTFRKNEVEALDDESIFQKFCNRGLIVGDDGIWRINPALINHVRERDWFQEACE